MFDMTKRSASIGAIMVLMTAVQLSLAQCPEGAKYSNEQKLGHLNGKLDRSNRASVECVFSLMDELTRKGDTRIIPVLIRNLDLKRTFDGPFCCRLEPYIDYPAIGDLSMFGEQAGSQLLDAIAQSTAGSLLSHNATIVLMLLQQTDPSEGIKILTHRAAKEQGEASDNLMKAARFAVSLCRIKTQECHDALNAAPKPTP